MAERRRQIPRFSRSSYLMAVRNSAKDPSPGISYGGRISLKLLATHKSHYAVGNDTCTKMQSRRHRIHCPLTTTKTTEILPFLLINMSSAFKSVFPSDSTSMISFE